MVLSESNLKSSKRGYEQKLYRILKPLSSLLQSQSQSWYALCRAMPGHLEKKAHSS